MPQTYFDDICMLHIYKLGIFDYKLAFSLYKVHLGPLTTDLSTK